MYNNQIYSPYLIILLLQLSVAVVHSILVSQECSLKNKQGEVEKHTIVPRLQVTCKIVVLQKRNHAVALLMEVDYTITVLKAAARTVLPSMEL
jgi:hypothetical protein